MRERFKQIKWDLQNIADIFKSLLKIAFFIKMIIIFVLVIRVIIIIINDITL